MMSTALCPACGVSAQDGTRFCEQCGIRLSDNTTRYLSAAVNLDPEYCDAAIEEFLVEPARAVPPSPGADSAAVLRDAVAARTRRRLRDSVLLVLLLVFALTQLQLLVLWAVVAVGARVLLGMRDGTRSSGSAAVAIAVGAVAVLAVYAVADPLLSAALYAAGLNGFDGFSSGTGPVWAVVLTSLLFAVLVADAYVGHWLVHTCFRRDRFLADPQGMRDRAEVVLRTIGSGQYKAELDRIADADHDAVTQGKAAVVVHRGFHPFVGAGVRTDSEGIAVSLERSDDDATPPTRIDVLGLHEQISAAMTALQASTSLGPGGRLADLEIGEQVLASSDELVTHLGSIPGRRILPTRRLPPESALDLDEARELADEPAEWVRYYRCYRIETWERDLIPSTYVHIGTDQTTLYFERVHCVLMPIARRFREIDRPVNDARPLGEAVVSLFLLPATVPRRIRAFFDATPIREGAGEIVPDRYGAAQSLRELASDPTSFHRYFQMADTHRYQQIVDRVLLRSIEEYLEAHGWSSREFQQAFRQTINDYRGAEISQSAIGPGATTTNTGPDARGNGGRPTSKPKGRQ